MQDFFNKAGNVAKSTASRAADKAGDLVEIGKIKAKISSARSDMSAIESKIGRYYFEQYMNGAAIDAAAGAMCEEIKVQMELIDELEKKIQEIKEA